MIFTKKLKELSYEGRFGIRIILGLVFVTFLATFLHFREVLVEILELNSKAPGYVVAWVDFEFPDPDATMILRQESIRDVGKIYRIPESEIKNVHHQMEAELLSHPYWRKESNSTFNEMYKALDAVSSVLTNARITDARTLKKQKELGILDENFYFSENPGNELPPSFWNKIKDLVESGYPDVSPASLTFILDYFEKQKWSLASDIDSQKNFKEMIEETIPQRYTPVKAGSRILDQGEKVTLKHIAMLKAMKAEISKSRNLWTIKTILSSLIFSLIITTCAALYLQSRHKNLFLSVRELAIYISIILLGLALGKAGEWVLLNSSTQWIEYVRYPIFIPFTSILLCILINEEVALFTTAYLSVVMGITLAVDHTSFLLINLLTGTIGVLFSTHLKKRKEFFAVSLKMWLVTAILVLAFNLAHKTLLSQTILIDFATTALNLFLLALLLVGLTPIFESFFGIMTDMTLMEFMDPTNVLLKRLSIEAPGTYQHSLSLGFIAEHVANSIGANGLFCRVTTLYHDIGKLNTPHYYTENQMLMGGNQFDIHQLLTPIESAYIIKAHVQDGATLAYQNNLPQSFIDIIYQHHGTTLIKFFYAKQIAELGGNAKDIDENAFRYPGPKPQTKEAAIIMLADSLEAASRSLDDNSEETIRNMVDRIASDKISDNQFDECPLTFHELSLIKIKFVEIIKATHHLRIKYPENLSKKK
jgi:putative nucleotidyltransferase with HDIG domain